MRFGSPEELTRPRHQRVDSVKISRHRLRQHGEASAKKDDDGALTRDETSHLLDVLKLDADNDLLKDEKGPHLEFSVEHQKMVELQEKMVQMEESQREILRVLGKAFPASSASAPDLTL